VADVLEKARPAMSCCLPLLPAFAFYAMLAAVCTVYGGTT
jgi:hypothetical protein